MVNNKKEYSTPAFSVEILDLDVITSSNFVDPETDILGGEVPVP